MLLMAVTAPIAHTARLEIVRRKHALIPHTLILTPVATKASYNAVSTSPPTSSQSRMELMSLTCPTFISSASAMSG